MRLGAGRYTWKTKAHTESSPGSRKRFNSPQSDSYPEFLNPYLKKKSLRWRQRRSSPNSHFHFWSWGEMFPERWAEQPSSFREVWSK
jgi:hypothetical protein